MRRFLLTVVTLLVASLLETCRANYTFEVLLQSYSNPRHKLANGDCCNSIRYDCSGTACNSIFLFCVRPFGYSEVDGWCSNDNQKYITSLFHGDSISFREGDVLNIQRNSTNPLVFNGSTWPGQVQLYTRVYNWNMFGNEFIDDIVQNWSLPVETGSYSSLQTFRSQRGHVILTSKARVMCADNYYGPYCSKFGTNDTALLPPTSSEKFDSEYTGSNITVTQNLNTDLNETGDSPKELAVEEGTLNLVGGSQVGRIVGGVVVGVVSLIVLSSLVVVCIWCWRRKTSERHSLAGTQDKNYKTVDQNSPQSSYSGTYRRVDNKIYNQLPTDEREEIIMRYEHDTDYTISEAATAPSDQSHGGAIAPNPLYISAPYTSQYSIVRRRDSDVSTSHSDEELTDEESRQKGQRSTRRKPVESQYSVVTRENMEHVEEASDSEASLAHSDGEPENEYRHEQESDFDPRSSKERSTVPLYENVPYNYS